MYGKFFASAFTGSMMASGAEVFAVWGYVIANAVDSHVELNPRLLAALIGSTPERMEQAIVKLCEPDEASRSKERDGRRLVKDGEYQYFVVNHAQYRKVRDEVGRREYNRIAKRKQRAKEASANVNPSVKSQPPLSSVSAHTEAEAVNPSIPPSTVKKSKAKIKSTQTPMPEGFELFTEDAEWAKSKGLTDKQIDAEEEKFVAHHRAKGSSFSDWSAAWRTWIFKAIEFGLEVKPPTPKPPSTAAPRPKPAEQQDPPQAQLELPGAGEVQSVSATTDGIIKAGATLSSGLHRWWTDEASIDAKGAEIGMTREPGELSTVYCRRIMDEIDRRKQLEVTG